MTKAKVYWSIVRILGPLIIGLMNTVLLRPEDIGTWKNYVGYAFLVIAVLNTIYLSTQLKKAKK